MNKYLTMGVTLASLAISGCGGLGLGEQSSFSCPGVPYGTLCKSPREVYQLTNGKNYDLGNEAAKKEQASAGTSEASARPGPDSPFSRPSVATNSGPMPILEPASVLRVWIAPWQDEKRDLHWPSYVFTEITPRKWSFGGVQFTGMKPLVPVQADYLGPSRGASKGSPSGDQSVQPIPQNLAVDFAAPLPEGKQ